MLPAHEGRRKRGRRMKRRLKSGSGRAVVAVAAAAAIVLAACGGGGSKKASTGGGGGKTVTIGFVGAKTGAYVNDNSEYGKGLAVEVERLAREKGVKTATVQVVDPKARTSRRRSRP